MSRSPGRRALLDGLGVDASGPRFGSDGPGVGSCISVWSVERPGVLPDLVVLLLLRSSIVNVAPEPGICFPAAPASN